MRDEPALQFPFQSRVVPPPLGALDIRGGAAVEFEESAGAVNAPAWGDPQRVGIAARHLIAARPCVAADVAVQRDSEWVRK